MNGLLYEIITNGWIDRDYIDAHTVGYAELEKRIKEYPPEYAEEVCDVPAEQVRQAAETLRQARWANAKIKELSPQILTS